MNAPDLSSIILIIRPALFFVPFLSQRLTVPHESEKRYIFTENDDLFDTPEVSFLEAEFLGLSFSAEDSQVSFSFIPGFFEVSEASFAYQIILSDEQGFGKVTFEQVPEPHSILGTVTAVGFGTFFK